MIKELNILNEVGYNLTHDEFIELKKRHHYIGEKIILDLVNGVNVVAKDLNDASKSKEKGFARVADSIFGNVKKRQNLINENLIEGLNSASLWLQDHSRQLSRIDIRIKDVADELYKTQDEILNFYGQFKEVDFRVEQLEDFQKSSTQRVDKLENRLTREEAYTHIDKEVEKIKNLHLPLELEIFTIIDNLASGKAGVYYSFETEEKEKDEFLQHIKFKIKNRLSSDELEKFLSYIELHREIKKLDPIEQKAIEFIGTQYSFFSDNNPIYEISDMIKVISTAKSASEVEYEIGKQSHVRTFMTLDSYIDETTNEFMTI